jgi:hypothetical protein
MSEPEITPLRLHALADDAELYGEGCREYAQGLRAAAIELEASLEREGRYAHALGMIARNSCCEPCREAGLVARAALGDAP